MIILNEKEYAEECLKNKTINNKPFVTLLILAKYYYHCFGYKKKKITHLLIEYMDKCCPCYSDDKLSWDDTIEKIAANAKKFTLFEIDGIWITKSELEAVAVKPAQYPEANRYEIAFAGRSNVGKSSLLNLLTGRKALARVSGSPGKTRTINFYLVNDDFRIVDLPGYGYAKLSRSETEKWGAMMEAYLSERPGLLKVVQLVDIRHEPSAQDVQMYDYLRYYGLDGVVVATKADKISKNQQQKSIRQIRQKLNMKKEDVVIPVSALKRTGQEELLNVIESILNKEESEDEHE